MSNKIILPFNDKKGNTYELNIDLDILSKDNNLSRAITGIGCTAKKNQQPIVADDDLSKLPEIFDIIKDMERSSKKNRWPWPIFTGNKKTQGVPSPNDNREKSINSGEGHNLYNTKSSGRQSSNPFIPPLNRIKPSEVENEVLIWFKGEVVEAKSVSELKKTVEQALIAGVRTNACDDGQRSFADTVTLKMLSIRCTKDEQKDILRELLLKGAMFSYDLSQDKRISEVYNKLYQEVQPHIDKKLKELKEIGQNAVQGGIVEDVGIDNKTFYMKFSKSSTVKPLEVLEGARKLGLDTGWVELGGHIISMGDEKFEVKTEKGGERNYIGLSDGSGFIMTLHSNLGEFKIKLSHDKENYDLVQVTVEDKELWNKLREEGGVIKENCLLGGKTIEKAIEEGGFKRSGMFSKEQAKEKISASNSSSETLWVDKTCRGSGNGPSRG